MLAIYWFLWGVLAGALITIILAWYFISKV